MFYARLLFLCALFAAPAVRAAVLPGMNAFIDEMVSRHHFVRAELQQAFAVAQYRPVVLKIMSAPFTKKPWPDYRAAVVNQRNLQRGRIFWQQNQAVLARAEAEYGVPAEIVVALLGVETFYGSNTGRFSTLDVLVTLAFDYPRRAEFFRGELEQYLLLAREQEFDLLSVRSSYAGALGIPQFMPSSYRKYAVDFDGDGKIDLLHSAADAIGSVAHYLQQSGWKKGALFAVPARVERPVVPNDPMVERSLSDWQALGVTPAEPLSAAAALPARLKDFSTADAPEFWLTFANFHALTAYNSSSYYAMAIYQLSLALRQRA